MEEKTKICFPSWTKKGKIFSREGGSLFKTHATRPIPILIGRSILRIFFASRCEEDTMHPTYIDVSPSNPSEVLDICEEPILSLGSPGSFDDCGICPVSIQFIEGRYLLYYAGLKRRRLVGYETSIGVAELSDCLTRCKRIYQGPIIGQDTDHPILSAAPYVFREASTYRMWYCSGEKWIFPEHGSEPIYSVYHASSIDGVSWTPSKNVVLPRAFEDEVITAPWVEKINSGWMMWYSYRGAKDIPSKAYRIGVAFSSDGFSWQRHDEMAGISTSSNGWDSEMICYPSLYSVDGRTIMLYCGNHVGRGGIGWAESDQLITTQVQA